MDPLSLGLVIGIVTILVLFFGYFRSNRVTNSFGNIFVHF